MFVRPNTVVGIACFKWFIKTFDYIYVYMQMNRRTQMSFTERRKELDFQISVLKTYDSHDAT